MKHLKIFEEWDYSMNSPIKELVENARKWSKSNFIEEYIDLNYITTRKILDNIKKGDVIELVRELIDDKGKTVYDKKTGIRKNTHYKTVTATEDYGGIWKFILDNTNELKEEAIGLYNANKNNKKPILKGKTIEVYHVSPLKFKQFKYIENNKTSGQLGADYAFFFFMEKSFALNYANSLESESAYLYTVKVNIDNQLELNGVNIGTNWGRVGELEQAEIEGYTTVLIKDADTGYGITDELAVFDDDNINITNIDII